MPWLNSKLTNNPFRKFSVAAEIWTQIFLNIKLTGYPLPKLVVTWGLNSYCNLYIVILTKFRDLGNILVFKTNERIWISDSKY
jgi:hypothetical protein